MDWRKSALTDTEKFYLWNGQGGCCANATCRKALDNRTMTIDHLAPKKHFESGTWDIRNFTILCTNCNSKKGINYLSGIVRPTLAADKTYSYATGGDFKGK
jgi:5-methylcytosine-specific restriction endonuclease McrA